MKNKLNIILILSIVAISLSSCFCDKGSGVLKSVKTHPGEFDAIYADIPGKIHIIKSDTLSVAVKTDDNLVDLIEIEVSRKKLKLKSDNCIKNCTSLEIWVYAPKIESIEAAGSVNIDSEEELSANELDIEVSGSGNVNLNINVNNLKSSITGSGKLILSGQVTEHQLNISGSGNIKAYSLNTQDCEAEISGSGRAQVNVSGDLDVDITGSGELIYQGNPKKVNSEVSGSGVVKTK